MQSLDTGTSPVISIRLPEDLVAALDAAAGTTRGARRRFVQRLLEEELGMERETAQALADLGRSTDATHSH